MAQKELVIEDAFRFGWASVRDNLYYFIRVMALFVTAQITLVLLGRVFYHRNTGLYIIICIIAWGISSFILMAYVQIGSRFTASGEHSFKDMYSAYKQFGNFLLGYVIYLLIIFGGLILMVVPGIIWAIKYQFFGYFIVDQKMNPIHALSASGKLTKGLKGQLLLLDLACFGTMILGVLACFIGQLVATPVVIIAMANVYRNLLAAEAEQSIIPPAEDS